MALPDDVLSTIPIPSDFLEPEDRPRLDLLTDYEYGGVALNDPSRGSRYQIWRIYYTAGSVRVVPEDGGTPVELFALPGITELSLAFDQNMNPAVAYLRNGLANLYWFDSTQGQMIHTDFGAVASPMVFLDDKREHHGAGSDVIFCYLKLGALYYRQQRDRYETERQLSAVSPGTDRILQIGMGVNHRLQIKLR